MAEAKTATAIASDAPKSPEPSAGQLNGVRSALKSAISGSSSGKKRKFIVKMVKEVKSADRNRMNDRAVYTLARKYVNLFDDGQPLPGSLEEDLTTTPDTFFDVSPYKKLTKAEAVRAMKKTDNSNKVVVNVLGKWSQLVPAQEVRIEEVQDQDQDHEQPLQKPASASSVRFNCVKYVISPRPLSMREGASRHALSCKKILPTRDASDEEIEARYEEIIKRQQERRTAWDSPQPCSQLLGESKQERFFENYRRTQRTWDRQLKTASKKLRRPAGDSVVARAEEYREKVEKLTALELATPSEVRYGIRNWGMGLRCSPQFKEARHYAVQVGSVCTGLWVQITDDPNKQAEIIRKPDRAPCGYKSFKDSPLLQDKIKREAKRLNEIVPMKDDHIEDLQLVGVNAFNIEYEGFKSSTKPKVLEIDVLEDGLHEPENL